MAVPSSIFEAPDLPSVPGIYYLKVKYFFFEGSFQVGLVCVCVGGAAHVVLHNNVPALLKNKPGGKTE